MLTDGLLCLENSFCCSYSANAVLLVVCSFVHFLLICLRIFFIPRLFVYGSISRLLRVACFFFSHIMKWMAMNCGRICVFVCE